VKVYDLYEDKKFYYLVLEYCSGGELMERIQPNDLANNTNILKEGDIALIMSQVLSALCFLHQKNIAHRDIKPENLLYSTKSPHSELKLIDFGIS
jgi:calcium-dependent protein kinase